MSVLCDSKIKKSCVVYRVCDVSLMSKAVPLQFIYFSVFPTSNLALHIFLISPHQRALENSNRCIEKACKTWKISESSLHNLICMTKQCCTNPCLWIHTSNENTSSVQEPKQLLFTYSEVRRKTPYFQV